MANLPSGAVTFLFTDIEGSTRLLRKTREAYAELLSAHHELLREAFANHGGHEVDTQGDAFFVVFASVNEAVLAAVEAQRRLRGDLWPDGAQVKVRMGIHTGQAAPANGRYTGLAVHRGARICAAAHGGQVLVSHATRMLLEDEEEGLAITLRDLGERLLKDFEQSVRLYQVDAAGIETDFPPLRALRADTQEALKAGSRVGATGSFVGRQQEFETLVSALDEAIAGQGRLVMLVGEPGIGKTRIALELANHAALRRAEVLWGRCYESEGAPPYWPWVQAIRSYAREHDSEHLQAVMGGGAINIAEIVDDIRARLPDLGVRASTQDPKQARFRLFDSIAAFLRNASEIQPVLLVLEDLHAADTDSLLLLEFLASQLLGAKLLLLGTYRDVEVTRQHPLTGVLAEVGRTQPFERILLRGLSEDETSDFVATRSGVAPPSDLVAALHAQTEGNPLFVTEVVRFLAEEGHFEPGAPITRGSWQARIPERVREVIGQRLNRLSEASMRALTLAAVIGRSFGFAQLRPLVDDLTEDQLVDALEEGLILRLIEEIPDTVGLYQFSHALIRETLLEELSTARRVRLHARIAEVLEELYGGDAEDYAAELAYHFGEAATVLGSEKVVRFSQLAGEQAIAAHAYQEAGAHFERALAFKEQQAMDAETASLLFGLARAELGARELYELGDTLARMVRAFEYFAGIGDEASAVVVAAHPIPPVWEPTEVPHVVARALTMVSEDSLDAGQLLSTLGWFLAVHQRDYSRGCDAFERSLAIAREHGDLALERRTLVNAAHADYWQQEWSACQEKGLHAIDLSVQADDQRTEMAAREWPARVGAIIGNVEDAKTHAATAVALAQKLRERHELANACMYSGWLYALEGDWQTARDLSDRALALEPREPRNLATRALLELQVGALDDGERHLQQLLDPRRVTAWSLLEKFAMAAFLPMAARVTGDDQRLDLARETAEAALAATKMPPFMHLYGRIGLAFVAVQRTDRLLAAEQYAAFESQRGTAIMMAGIAVDRVLGLLAATLGQEEKARRHLEDAIAFTRRANYRPEYAWAASDYADLLVEQGLPGDSERAHELHDEALATARSLAMRPLAERIVAHSAAS
jgi:class 3 adenylate cyclase/tetratricopeptide (TPR) repeat protein